MLYAYCEATVPKVTVILRKAYGGAYIGMCNKELGADLVLAWPTAQIAVMGASGAVNIISSVKKEIREAEDPEALKAEKIAEYEEKFNNPYIAAGLGDVDDVIEPATTRQRIISAFDMLSTKRESAAVEARQYTALGGGTMGFIEKLSGSSLSSVTASQDWA